MQILINRLHVNHSTKIFLEYPRFDAKSKFSKLIFDEFIDNNTHGINDDELVANKNYHSCSRKYV